MNSFFIFNQLSLAICITSFKIQFKNFCLLIVDVVIDFIESMLIVFLPVFQMPREFCICSSQHSSFVSEFLEYHFNSYQFKNVVVVVRVHMICWEGCMPHTFV